MSVRINLSVSDDVNDWILLKAKENGMAKNAYVISLILSAKAAEENRKLFENKEMIAAFNNIIELQKKEAENAGKQI